MILVACEESGTLRDAFLRKGYPAVSCDTEPSRSKYGRHYQCDVRRLLQAQWTAVIAFPPCTDLTVSGNAHARLKRADGRQQRGIEFFLEFTRLRCPWGIENPVGVMSTVYRKPDQIIQPWQFGHDASKRTCLWLNRLPCLTPTNILPLPPSGRWSNQTASGQNKLGPSPTRARDRSATYQGIAEAMAAQWGPILFP